MTSEACLASAAAVYPARRLHHRPPEARARFSCSSCITGPTCPCRSFARTPPRLLLGLVILSLPGASARAQQPVRTCDSLAVTTDSVAEPGMMRSLMSKAAAPVRFVRNFRSRSDWGRSRRPGVRLRDGTRLTTQGDEVGVIEPNETEFVPLVLDMHVVFDNTLFIPSVGTRQRIIAGELGHDRPKLGDGYQIHGTPYR